MASKGLGMKALIVTDNNLYDVNDRFLEAGKYYFEIQSFTNNNSVIGRIISENSIKNTQFEFRFFSLMTMIIKAQSYLSRRLDNNSLSSTMLLNKHNMPNYPSPKQQNKKRISRLRKLNEKKQCMICLTDTDGYDFSVFKLKCGHSFHIKCIDSWKRHSNTCPICRKNITIKI